MGQADGSDTAPAGVSRNRERWRCLCNKELKFGLPGSITYRLVAHGPLKLSRAIGRLGL
jgi:hypothetical protein